VGSSSSGSSSSASSTQGFASGGSGSSSTTNASNLVGALSSSTAASLGLGYFNDMAPFVGDGNAYYTDSDVNFFSSGTVAGQQIFTDIKNGAFNYDCWGVKRQQTRRRCDAVRFGGIIKFVICF